MKTEWTSKTSRRLSSLDGIRAISIILVILGHLGGTRGFGNGNRLDLGIGDYAHLGVVVFFVISGFLITSLLLSEHRKNGAVSLKLFYARRSIRIFPAAYAYLAVVALLWWWGSLQLKAGDFWHAVTYTVNFQPDSSWQVAHLWSLSVEEQFYLLWPLAFVVLGPRHAVWAAAAFILLSPIARSVNRLFLIGTPYHDLPMFPMVADSLATGCLLARLRGWLENQGWYLRLFQPVYSFLLLVLLLLINRFMGYTVVSVVGVSIVNFILAILIHRSVYQPGDRLGQLLNWKPVIFVGTLSYSLYLWQQLFINREAHDWINTFPQNLALTVFTALSSYLLLEKPLLHLRHRLQAGPA